MGLSALLAAAFAAPPAFALPVDLAGRDDNGILRFHSADLSAGDVPSVVTPPGIRSGRSPVVLAPALPGLAPLALGPIFAQVRIAPAGPVTSPSVFGASVGPQTSGPSLVSHALEVSEPPTRVSSMGFGGVAVPAVPGGAAAPSQSTFVVVTVEGTIDPGQPGGAPISNPLPGAAWMFATGLGLFPVLLKRCRRRLPRADGSMG